jgi:hypothetical protein
VIGFNEPICLEDLAQHKCENGDQAEPD